MRPAQSPSRIMQWAVSNNSTVDVDAAVSAVLCFYIFKVGQFAHNATLKYRRRIGRAQQLAEGLVGPEYWDGL